MATLAHPSGPEAGARWRGRGEPDERATADALADLVAAIGSGAFPARFLAAMRVLAGVELCSVFRRDREGVRLIFAEGERSPLPDFPLKASRDYARGYWRSDAQLTRLARSRGRVPVIVRRRAAEIADPDYRAACYDRAGVIERLSILWPGQPGFIANGYRTVASAPFSTSDVTRLERYAGLLIATLKQHLRADASAGHLLNEGALVETLLALECGLSTREAEVAAAMILGETQERIAQARQLSLATIITYRRRAYGKLGVGSRHELVALHRRLLADPDGRLVDRPDSSKYHTG